MQIAGHVDRIKIEEAHRILLCDHKNVLILRGSSDINVQMIIPNDNDANQGKTCEEVTQLCLLLSLYNRHFSKYMHH